MTEEELIEVGTTRAFVGKMLVGDEHLAPIIEEDGRIIGFGLGEISRGYLFAVFVRCGYEGRGVGRAILRYLEDGMHARGQKNLVLHCGGEATVRAHGFFRHMGWHHDGTIVDGMLRYVREI